MTSGDILTDTAMRVVAFARVQELMERCGVLSSKEINQGLIFEGERIPLFNRQSGISKPMQMQSLLSITTRAVSKARRAGTKLGAQALS